MESFETFLKSLGFEPSNSDASVFVLKDKTMYIAVYVDDLLNLGPNLDLMNEIEKKLQLISILRVQGTHSI